VSVELVSTGVLWMRGWMSAWAASTDARVKGREDAEEAMIDVCIGVAGGSES
jgi:hypothetical protein